MGTRVEFSTLQGKKVTRIKVRQGYTEEKNYIAFETSDDKLYLLHHEQDCCESVWIEDIDNDIQALTKRPTLPLVVASLETRTPSEVTQTDADFLIEESSTWSFYKLANPFGSVTIRWFGTSNGWYSETVDFFDMTGDYATFTDLVDAMDVMYG